MRPDIQPRLAGGDRSLEAPPGAFLDAESVLLAMQDVVGRKWQPVVVYHLLRSGPMGFSALGEHIEGVSAKMLSESLTDLQAAGIVHRELLDDQPVRVEYRLTERGTALEPVLATMLDWGAEHATGTTVSREEV